MKTGVSTALKNHLAGRFQTTATCWKVTRLDGQIKAYTDHDQNIVFGEGSPVLTTTYLAASGYTASNIESSDALNVDTLEVEGMLVSDSITEDDLKAGLWDHARVEIFIVNWADLSMGKLIQRVGTLGEVTLDRGVFRAELRGLTQAFARSIGELTSPGCLARLGDERCQVNLATYTVTGTVEEVRADNMTIFDSNRNEPGPGEEGSPADSAQVFNVGIVQKSGTRTQIVVYGETAAVVSGGVIALSEMGDLATTEELAVLNGVWLVRDATHSESTDTTSFYIEVALPVEASSSYGAPDGSVHLGTGTHLGVSSGYFDHGVLTWTSGNNLDLSMEVKHYVPGMICLALPMPFAIEAGDTYSMHAGCDLLLETCRDRFDNVVNMRAFPHLPGVDRIVQVARRQ